LIVAAKPLQGQGCIMEFGSRQVLITGGTGALGIAVVGALIAAGAACHVPYFSVAEAERFPYRDDKRVKLVVAGDFADEDIVAKIFNGVPQLWASIHLVGGYAFGSVAKTTKAALLGQVEKNFVTCFLCCRAAADAIRRAGGGGRIVNVAARPALEWRAGANMAAYAASKAAVAAFTTAFAQEVVKERILVNAVAPSIIDTPVNRKDMPDADHSIWPKAEEVAATILFLASPENKVTNGAIVPVYGQV
jgi:NAD(P)-dependent dehydrogenase (short-subunit alcohol dehydrogenase family)